MILNQLRHIAAVRNSQCRQLGTATRRLTWTVWPSGGCKQAELRQEAACSQGAQTGRASARFFDLLFFLKDESLTTANMRPPDYSEEMFEHF